MLVRITNEPRDYAWGSASAISEYLGLAATGVPQAELWLGAHPTCPAKVDGGRGLDEVLDEAGLAQPRMMLKVLAAAQPLSLQVHPTAGQAADGFARENAAGVPLASPVRTYRDPHAKPELVVAVSRFEALSGFRPVEHSLAVLDALALEDHRVGDIARRVRISLRDAVAWMLGGGGDVDAAIHGLVEGAERLPERFAMERDTVRRIAAFAPGDPGIGVSMLLHRVSLEPQEALFLAAGNLHAYLEGLAIELMGASDNVVRGGMTAKHVDRGELLRIVDFTPLSDPRLLPESLEGATRWRPPAGFELRLVHGEHRVDRGEQALVLARASTEISTPNGALRLRRGDAAYTTEVAGSVVRSDEAWLAVAG